MNSKAIVESELFADQIIEAEEVTETKPKTEIEALQQFFGLDINEDELAELELGKLAIAVDKETGEVKKVQSGLTSLHDKMRHRIVAFLMARGYDNKSIAETTGYDPQYVSRLARMPHVRRMAQVMMDKIFEKIDLDRNLALSALGGQSVEAAETLIEMMRSAENPKLKTHAAVKILEALGMYEKKGQTEKEERSELVQLIIQNNEKSAATQVNITKGEKKE